MPAPLDSIIGGMRNGAARHLFFQMTHSQGIVRVWDGVGNITLDGATYQGVGGFARLEGVSDSGDIQNHEIVATLNGVSLPNLASVDPDVRGETVTIKAAWYARDTSELIASRTLFVGSADILALKVDADSQSLSVRCRGPLAEWTASPRSYYTDADQQRRYAGDTGFKFVKSLENATVAGWGATAETSGGKLIYMPSRYHTATGGGITIYYSYGHVSDDILGAVLGFATWGLAAGVHRQNVGSIGGFVVVDSTVSVFDALDILDDVTADVLSLNDYTGSNTEVGSAGVQAYLDASNDARTNAGNLVRPDGETTSNKLRKQTTISADGAPGATTFSVGADSFLAENYLIKTGGTLAGNNQSDLVYDNKSGRCVQIISNNVRKIDTTGAAVGTYVESGTGNACSTSSGTLKVSGVDCVLSANGVVLTNAGNRIVLSGGTSDEFLRVWT